MATLANVGPSEDPLSRVLNYHPDETPEQRSARQQAEHIAKQISNEIDDYLKKEASKSKNILKILLLGQAESGKSTTLKNMKLVYAAESFRKERASWPPIIHFNILRHVVQIIILVEEALAQEEERARASSSSEDLPDLFNSEHRLLCMKLKPLVDIEASMTKHLLQSLQRRRGEEVAVHSHFAWTKHFHRSGSPDGSAVGDSLKGEMRRVLNVSCDDILRLWNDSKVRQLLHSQEIQLEHEAGFFLEEEDLKRITAFNYEPSDLDVCKARLKTVGVTETHLRVRSHVGPGDWVVYDVGGSRTQRASWKPFFDDVRAIVFLAPLSAFNQTLEEMPSINRLEDSLLLWRDISASPLLARAHLILFLNKIDLLAKKLQQGIEFRSYLVGYTGSNDVDSVCKYMKRKFIAVNKDAQDKMKESERVPNRVVRIFRTSVLDLESTRRIIIEVEDSILGDNLTSSAMV